VIAASRARYATPRAQVEALLSERLSVQEAAPAVQTKPAAPPVPTVAEVPTVTVSEKEIVATPKQESAVPELKPPHEERGIGGHQHNLIRERIEAAARELGFHAHREKPTGDGRKIDVALERDGQVIACEISIMTPVDYEVGNADKCVKAGCHHVAMICPDPSKLAKIQKAVSGCLPPEALARIGYYSPDQFMEYLKALKRPEQAKGEPEEKTLGKYKVRRRAASLTLEEIQAREAAAHRVLAERMRARP